MRRNSPMEPQRLHHLHFLSLPLTIFFLSLCLSLSSPFSPLDNYLLNCGSTSNATLDNRVFVPDWPSLSAGRSISLPEPDPPRNSHAIYHSARVFTASLTYKLATRTNGSHLVRLHFWPFKGQGFDLSQAKFSVLVDGLTLLSEFSTQVGLVKEFVMSLDSGETELVFEPIGSLGFGFVSAIEVISAPKDLIVDEGARLVGGNAIGEFKNLSISVLETLHRINVGGPKLTPFNDTLWRTWIPDDDYLVLKSAAKSVFSSHSPNYQSGGATREIAPDNVYMTAKEMNRDKGTVGFKFNVSWGFPVGLRGVQHLVRLHFCDIVSTSVNQLYFDVYINDFEAYKDLDLSSLSFDILASPVYVDFVVNSDDAGMMRVSVGPSILSSPFRVNAILNGLEILRMVNLPGSHGEVSRKGKIGLVVALAVGGGVLLIFAILVIALVCKRRKKKKSPRPRRTESTGWTPLRIFGGSSHSRLSEVTAITSPGTNGNQRLRIPFADILFATNNFDDSLVIGQGGFGMVYKGVLKDNTKIAIKRGVPGSRQGLPEFQTEINVLSRIRHRHLVSLIGYCEEQSEMILVYEYMEKGPLKNLLYGSGHPPLSWKQRLEICICAARGIHYLHTGSTQGIIHRDIKSTNILLDANYVAKVADFGLSRSGPCLDETHVSTGVKGSFGYLDPEYFRRQQLTDKSDVYSFGVVLFEVLCARPAVDPLLTREQVNLAEWAMQWQKKGMLEHIIDPNLAGQIKPSSLKKFGETGEKCLADYGVDRPTMGDVLWNLEYILQLQESGPIDQEEGITGRPGHQPDTPPPEASSSNDGAGRANANESSDLSTTRVFSQLITNEGR